VGGLGSLFGGLPRIGVGGVMEEILWVIGATIMIVRAATHGGPHKASGIWSLGGRRDVG